MIVLPEVLTLEDLEGIADLEEITAVEAVVIEVKGEEDVDGGWDAESPTTRMPAHKLEQLKEKCR